MKKGRESDSICKDIDIENISEGEKFNYLL